jgi:hypothetical protein
MGGSIFIRKIFNESTPGMYSFLCKRIENRPTLIHISTYLEKENYLETFSLFGPKKLIFALEGMPRKKKHLRYFDLRIPLPTVKTFYN